MKGYNTSNGYMGYVEGKYILFASEQEYLFKKRTFFELNDFLLVSEQGYPKNQAICIYIWKDKNEQLFWQTGIYNQKLKQFSVCYGTVRYAINEDKVIAWKKMNADAVALEIMDRRNQKQ